MANLIVPSRHRKVKKSTKDGYRPPKPRIFAIISRKDGKDALTPPSPHNPHPWLTKKRPSYSHPRYSAPTYAASPFEVDVFPRAG